MVCWANKQGDMNELLTEDVVNMGKQIEELSSQYEISESTSRQFQEQALHLEQTLGTENAALQKQVQEQAQELQELTAQYEASQKAAQEHQEQGLRYREEAASLGEQNNLAQTRLTELEEENARLQQEKQRLQDTLTVVWLPLSTPSAGSSFQLIAVVMRIVCVCVSLTA